MEVEVAGKRDLASMEIAESSKIYAVRYAGKSSECPLLTMAM